MPDVEAKLSELELRIAVLERENVSLLERLLMMEAARSGGMAPAEEKPVFEKPVVRPETEEPAVDEPVSGSLASQQPVPDEPMAGLPASEQSELHKLLGEPVTVSQRRDKAKELYKSMSGSGHKPESGLAAELMEARIGGTWLNRIGIVAFIFGLGFFLKYSFDNNWIGQTGRIAIGILAGLCLLAGGEIGQRKGYKIFSQGLTGGGIAALYFAIFAAFSFYHLIGQITALGIMTLITLTAVMLALRYDSYAIALLGIIGGFLTPFFLSTGKPNEVGLFSYIALLDCGILALAYFKQWRSINIISFVFTLAILALWVISPYARDPVWTNQIFYIVFFAIFACLAIFYNMVHRVRTKPDDLTMIIANATAFFVLSYLNLQPHYDRYIGFLAFAMAVLYFIMGYLAWARNREDRFLVLSLWGISVVFLTITMPLQLHGKWITVAWAVESAVLLWVGCYNKSLATRRAAWGVLGIALWRLLADGQIFLLYYYLKPFRPFLNLHMLPFAASIISVFVMARFYYRYRETVRETEKSLWL